MRPKTLNYKHNICLLTKTAITCVANLHGGVMIVVAGLGFTGITLKMHKKVPTNNFNCVLASAKFEKIIIFWSTSATLTQCLIFKLNRKHKSMAKYFCCTKGCIQEFPLTITITTIERYEYVAYILSSMLIRIYINKKNVYVKYIYVEMCT